MTLQADILVWAIVIHLIADWPLQTEWMACNKSNLLHPASWVHSGVHAVLLALIFPWYFALGIGFSHMLIDTRVPVQWWTKKFKGMPPTAPMYSQIELWMDQVFHIIVLAAAVLLLVAIVGR